MKVVELGLECELEGTSADGRSAHFSVTEFAVFSDGRRVTLHDDRGYGGRVHKTGSPDPALNYWTHVTIESLVDDALLVLIPDDTDPPDDHDWARLVALLEVMEVTTSRTKLRSLPYVIEFGDNVLARLGINREDHDPVVINWESR